jgi:hypothetical protein
MAALAISKAIGPQAGDAGTTSEIPLAVAVKQELERVRPQTNFVDLARPGRVSFFVWR